MNGVFIVFLAIVLPFFMLFSGVVIMIQSRNNDTAKGMIVGVLLTVFGFLWLLGFSIFIVHELSVYAPYFNGGGT